VIVFGNKEKNMDYTDKIEKIYFNNGLYALSLIQGHPVYYGSYKYKLIKTSNHADPKTIIKRPDIPEGTIFDKVEIFRNLYGTHLRLQYKGHQYDIEADRFEIAKNFT